MLPLRLYTEGLYRDIRRQSTIITIAAGIALVVAALGLFGMASFVTEQRTKEIGIRKAMGADSRQIVSLLLRQFATPVLWAFIIAVPIAWWLLAEYLSGFAQHVALSPWPFIAGGLATLLVSFSTVLWPTLSVAQRPPVEALRYE
jgi:putative ABC transport system permease protein